MSTVQISLNKHIADMAMKYAATRGETLTNLVEQYLSTLVIRSNAQHESKEIPEPIMKLLGAATPIADDDLNGREAYAEFLKRKHA